MLKETPALKSLLYKDIRHFPLKGFIVQKVVVSYKKLVYIWKDAEDFFGIFSFSLLRHSNIICVPWLKLFISINGSSK